MLIHDVPSSMNPDVRDLWVTALDSGLYTQGKYHLRVGNAFSAEGVLCDLAVLAKVQTPWEKIDGTWFFTPMTPGHTAIPIPTFEWAGFAGMHRSQLLPLTFEGARVPLYHLEDRVGLDFVQIAQLIKEQY